MLLWILAGPCLARASRDGHVLESSVVFIFFSGELLDCYTLSVSLLDLFIQRLVLDGHLTLLPDMKLLI